MGDVLSNCVMPHYPNSLAVSNQFPGGYAGANSATEDNCLYFVLINLPIIFVVYSVCSESFAKLKNMNTPANQVNGDI